MVARSNRRTTKWSLFFHYFTIFYAILSGIILVPLYLRFIAIDLYGAWLAASNLLAWITIVDPGLSNVIMQKTSMAYVQRDVAALNGLLTNGLVLSLVVALVVLGAGWVVSQHLMTLLNLDTTLAFTPITPAFLMAVSGSALLLFSYGITAFNMGMQSSLGVGLVFMFTELCAIALTVWLLHAGLGLNALALALVFRGIGLFSGNLIYLVWRAGTDDLRLRPSFAGFRELIRLMTFTFLGKAVGSIANNMDALIITRYLGVELAPVYALTRKAPDLSRSMLERPANAFMPAISALWGAGEVEKARGVLLRLLRIMLWSMGLAGVGLWLLNGAFVTLWVGPALYAGDMINGLFMAGIVVMVFATSLSNLCYALGNIQGNSIITFLQGLISIPLMIAGAHYLGMIGVVVAPLAAALLVSMTYYPRVFVRLLRIGPLEIRAFLLEMLQVCVAAALIAAAFSNWADPGDWCRFSAVTLAMTLGYLLVLWPLSFAFRQECRGVWQRLRRSSPRCR